MIRSVLFLMLTVLALPAVAGSFSVSPLRFYMTPRDRATSVTVTNNGAEELVMQADIYAWTQKADGEDELTLTEDLFLSPPIIKLAGNARQVVRLALLAPSKSPQQRYYRIILREVPEALPPKEGVSVQLALAFSLPIFITPRGLKSQVDCQVERKAANSVNAVCVNNGNAYALLGDMVLKTVTGKKLVGRDSGGYLLPGVKRSIELALKDGKIPAGKAKLQFTLDDGSTPSFDVNVAE